MYYESHVTIEPVFDEKLEFATNIALRNGFKIANLLMQKREADTPERSKYDTFMTGHSVSGTVLSVRTRELVNELKECGFKVWRYKIEHVVLDSRTKDEWELLDDRTL